MNYTANEIADMTCSKIVGDGDLRVKNIAFDSRSLFSVQDRAFLAINTTKNSGEKYINTAIEKGIKVIISEHKTVDTEDISWILVEDSVSFIQQLAKKHLKCFKHLRTVGITGSNGKTIVKEWLYQSLWSDYDTVKSPKSFNSQIGLPLSLLEINEKHRVGIFEVGISKPGEMSLLEDIFSPEIGILTHIGTAHSANFASEEELIDEKIRLFKSSPIIIFNGDNLLAFNKIKSAFNGRKLVSYGFWPSNDLKPVSDWRNNGKEIKVTYFGEEIIFPLLKRDEATLMNALAIIAVLKEFGLTNEKIVEKLSSLKSVEMRLESINGIRNNLVINDSFNLDIDSLKIAFQFIREYKKEKKTLILTDIVDVKEDPDVLYREVAALVNDQQFDCVFLVGESITQYEKYFATETYSFNDTLELIESQQLNHIEDSLILLKGARKFAIEKVKNLLELQKHDTVMEVNLNAILHNINVHKALLHPETKMMAMVKAYSYGLGGYEIAEFLQHHHIDYLGVAYADEGADLRKNGITTPIIVMNPEQHSYHSIIEYNLEPEIYSFRVLDLFYEALQEQGVSKQYPIHIKLETGMHRLGFKTFELAQLTSKINAMNLQVASIFSHLSTSDMDGEKEYTLKQIEIFTENTQFMISALGYRPTLHILNSAGITTFPEHQFDMVRIGIGMVGISSSAKIRKQLHSAVVLKTVISQISEVKKGESVGYSRRHIAPSDTRIATVPVGYADGIPRLIGNMVGNISIKNKLFPIVGNVCMDMMMIDIGNADVQEGDEVIIFNSKPTLEQFAAYCKTIPYEVLTSISRRVKRIYIKN
ncbi:MAG: bifunctional UDP-N-acetylmuramoyl-tripeptide:D-alanyl-D-alanine ligase/alanine racemase [Weeksellaceae bacterium]|nr:bifunctional UDP-N-acetylmuramoyl-tripeptide:D-alanyl-D-alanine ligase/alanine racemase [Weeksellaceae bacterium]